MSGWDVMAEPFLMAARLALVVFALTRVRVAMRRTRRRSAPVLAMPRPARVTDTSIVASYNDALLSGWPAGERATFDEVADRVGTSADHVRTVIARHWAA